MGGGSNLELCQHIPPDGGPAPPPTHQSVLTGEPFMTQAASWGRRDVRRCLPTDLHSAVFTGRRLQTQPSIPRGVKKKPGT